MNRRNSGGFQVASALLGALVVTSLSLVPGCKKKDEEKCTQALQVTRQALQAEDFALARQWRDYAYKHCGDEAGLAGLDQEIVGKQQEIEKRKAEQAQQEQRSKQIVQLFGQWAGGAQNDASRAASNVSCDHDDDEQLKKSKERWCVGERQVTGLEQPFRVRYWEADPAAALFWMAPGEAVSCEALGAHTMVKQWDVPAAGGQSVKRSRCDMTSGSMAGLGVVVTDAKNAGVHAFTKKYLEKDPTVRGKLD